MYVQWGRMASPRIVYDPGAKPTGKGRGNTPETIKEPWRGGRGFHRWWYTYEKVAALAGVQVEAVRRAACRQVLDMDDLLAVARWIERARKRKRS